MTDLDFEPGFIGKVNKGTIVPEIEVLSYETYDSGFRDWSDWKFELKIITKNHRTYIIHFSFHLVHEHKRFYLKENTFSRLDDLMVDAVNQHMSLFLLFERLF